MASLCVIRDNVCPICLDNVYPPEAAFVNPEIPFPNACLLDCHHVIHPLCAYEYERHHQRITQCFFCFNPVNHHVIPSPTIYEKVYQKTPEIMASALPPVLYYAVATVCGSILVSSAISVLEYGGPLPAFCIVVIGTGVNEKQFVPFVKRVGPIAGRALGEYKLVRMVVGGIAACGSMLGSLLTDIFRDTFC